MVAAAAAQPATPVQRVQEQVVAALPMGWKLAEAQPQQHPYGHHYCDRYDGPTGTKLTLVGPTAVAVRWKTESGEDRATDVAFESIELWLMPGGYRDARLAWLCLHRPVQPVHLVDSPQLQVFGRTSHRLDPPDRYAREVLPRASEIWWPESPATDPALLSWHTWQRDLAHVLMAKP